MKLDGYRLVHKLLEARFNLPSSSKRRNKIADLKKQYAAEENAQKRRALIYQIKKAQSDLALRPTKAYSMHRSY